MNKFTFWLKHNEPAVMLVTGLTGIGISSFFLAKNAIKASKILEKKKIEADTTKLPKKEVAKVIAKCYIPPVVTMCVSAGCIVASYKCNMRRNAALATALAASETALSEYQRHVISTIGDSAEEGIRKAIATEKVEQTIQQTQAEPPKLSDKTLEDILDSDKVNCFEGSTQRRFESSKEDIRRLVNDLNQERLAGFCSVVTLNDFYTGLNLDTTSIGGAIGWNLDNPVDIHISAIEINGVPMLYVEPRGITYLYE